MWRGFQNRFDHLNPTYRSIFKRFIYLIFTYVVNINNNHCCVAWITKLPIIETWSDYAVNTDAVPKYSKTP